MHAATEANLRNMSSPSSDAGLLAGSAQTYHRAEPRANSRPLAFEIRRLVDIAHDPGIVDLEQFHPFGVSLEELTRTILAAQGRKLLVEPPRESDRMSALAVERRCGDRCAFLEGLGDDPDRFGTDERHVGERDDPTIGVGSRAQAGGEARSHALARVLAHDRVATGVAQQLAELLRARPDDRDGFGEGIEQVS